MCIDHYNFYFRKVEGGKGGEFCETVTSPSISSGIGKEKREITKRPKCKIIICKWFKL